MFLLVISPKLSPTGRVGSRDYHAILERLLTWLHPHPIAIFLGSSFSIRQWTIAMESYRSSILFCAIYLPSLHTMTLEDFKFLIDSRFFGSLFILGGSPVTSNHTFLDDFTVKGQARKYWYFVLSDKFFQLVGLFSDAYHSYNTDN